MNSWKQFAYYIGLVTYLGIMITSCVFVGYYLGVYLDKRLSTEMTFTIIGVLLGSFTGLYMLYRMATKNFNKQ